MGSVTIVYHWPCIDGAFAAYAAHLKFGDEARYVKFSFKLDPEVTHEWTGTVYFLDCAPPPAVLEAIHPRLEVVILDHHDGNLPNIPPELAKHCDTKLSGCALAWRYFHPDKPLPSLFKEIAEYDVGRQLDRRFVISGIWQIKSSPDIADVKALMDEGDGVVARLHKLGEEFYERVVQVGSSTPTFTTYKDSEGEYSLAYMHVPDHRYITLVADMFQIRYPETQIIALITPSERNKRYRLSFRSKYVDVAALAKRNFDGGGHSQAAGAEVDEIPW